MNYIEYTPAENNAAVNTCASKLGTVAVHSEVLPAECSDFEEGLRGWLDERTIYSPDGLTVEKVERTMTYNLLSATDFRDRYIVTPKDAAREARAKKLMAGTTAGLGSLLSFTMLTVAGKRRPS